MKILLIEPPFYRLYDPGFSLNKYPLSLGYLTAILKTRTPHQVLVYNADFSGSNKYMKHSFLSGKGFDSYLHNINNEFCEIWNEVRTVIRDYNPDLVGISAKSQNYRSACIVARIVKSINQRVLTVVGGPHPTIMEKDVLNFNEIDFAVMGEGEITFLELINTIETKSDFNEVLGLVWRNKDKVVVNKKRPLIADLDSIPNPYLYASECLKDHALFPDTSFRSVFATRGCPFNCTFCGSNIIWSRKVRFRSPQNVAAEIKYLQSTGVRYINFDDDTFGVNRKYLIELCDTLTRDCKGLKWSCEIHLRILNEEILQSMKRAGCDLIKVGIESGNNKILHEINKHITFEEASRFVKMINEAGIHTMSFFMAGFPQETEETMLDTVKAIKQTEGFVTYSIFTPYIGTEAYRQCTELNLIPPDFDVSTYNHQSPNNCFTPYILPERFREIAREIEKLVDKKNANYGFKTKLKRITPVNIIKKILLFFKRSK